MLRNPLARSMRRAPRQAASRTYRPRLETLEQRWCPAVTATISAGTLLVTGDAAPNAIEILDFGGGEITVVGDGQQQPFFDVGEIFVATLEGADIVRYHNPKSFQIISAGPAPAL